MTKQGLIVGKFYPPHRGHKYLIDSGRAQVDELTVIICQKPHERPAGELRAAWLREIHPDVRVMLIDDIYDENDSQIWAENCLRWLGFAPDVVFSSEDYGDGFAQCLGCVHVSIDKSRTIFPISGTKVRSTPLEYWRYIEPPVRGWYAKRICLVGAESTGKTTLAKALAAHYLTSWVREYGREYSERKHTGAAGYNWTSDEFEHIAQVQCDRENAAARHANKILICDTDAFATGIWHRRYLQFPSPEVAAIVDRQKPPDLYLLTDIKTPFVQDGTRDGKAIRNWMHETFIAELTAHNRPFHIISGSPQQRLKKAIAIIDRSIGN
jgi:HTH-type transcriptional regulator, transcriptional repressor of NAD biosynthesis genes